MSERETDKEISHPLGPVACSLSPEYAHGALEASKVSKQNTCKKDSELGAQCTV